MNVNTLLVCLTLLLGCVGLATWLPSVKRNAGDVRILGTPITDVGVVSAVRPYVDGAYLAVSSRPIASSTSKDVNVVIATAFAIHRAGEAGIDTYQKFLYTLRQHFSGPIVIFVEMESPEEPMPPVFKKLCSRLGVSLEFMDEEVVWEPKYERWRLANGDRGFRSMLRKRFRWSAEVCARMTDTGKCLMTDFRDVFFQADPFLHVPKDVDMLLAQEPTGPMGLTLAEDVDYDAEWIRTCYGDDALAKIGDQPIICAGTIIGTPKALRVYHDEIFLADALEECNDQGILNYKWYTGELGRVFWQHELNVQVEPFGFGSVATVGVLDSKCSSSTIDKTDSCESEKMIDLESGLFLNKDGSVPAIIHQWDRVPALVDILEKRVRELKSQRDVGVPRERRGT